MNKKQSTHPAWALSFKKPGTELRCIRGRFYIYEYKTVYDNERKRPKKISGKLLGSVTKEEGFIPSRKRELEEGATVTTAIHCKEYGVVELISKRFTEYSKALEKVFPMEWKEILAIAYCRFVYRCPLKSIPFRLASSYFPEQFGIKPFGEKHASGILNHIGRQREKMLQYMRSFMRQDDYILMDGTNIFSNSNNIPLAKMGYNKDMQYDTQFNLLYIYSANSRMPLYYRLLPGNIRDVKAFKNSILEAGLQSAIVITDKGFYSQANVNLMQKENLQFIMPLKRDNAIINYKHIVNNKFKTGTSYFEHEKRIIWYKKFLLQDNLKLYLFLDEQLKAKEDKDYLTRIKTIPEKYNIKNYHQKKNWFGTIAMLSDIDDKPQTIYQTYKSRMEIEEMFDSMKNVMDADHTYMQDEQTLQGWMFVNHITMQWYQQLYIDLKEKKLLASISVNDVIQHLTDVKKININNQWYPNEITLYTQKLMAKLGSKIV